jgi:hypothetical protein
MASETMPRQTSFAAKHWRAVFQRHLQKTLAEDFATITTIEEEQSHVLVCPKALK